MTSGLVSPKVLWMRLRRSFGSLRTQLIVWNVVALSVLLIGLGFVSRYAIRSFLMTSVDRELENVARHMMKPPPKPFNDDKRKDPNRDLRQPGPPPEDGGNPPRDEGQKGGPDRFHGRPDDFHGHPDGGGLHLNSIEDSAYRPHSFDLQGKSIPPTDTRPIWDSSTLSRSLTGEIVPSTVEYDDEQLRVISAPTFEQDRDGHERITGVIQVAYLLRDVNRAISGVNQALMAIIPFGLLGAGWAGATLTDRVLRRVHRMTQAAGQLGARDFSQRLPVSGNDEFSELAETFNDLLGRIETAFDQQERSLEQQRRFTADASHELKTPLTIIKGSASMALSGASTDPASRRTFAEIDLAASTMSQLVQDLLLLARADGGQMARNPIEILVRELLERAMSQAAHLGNGAKMTLSLSDDTLTLTGNETELHRLFSNLLTNAVRYTPAEGSVTISAERELENDKICVKIRDTGEGIAPEHLPHLGERFYRVDTSRTRPTGGTGLGLSICKGIVEAHGGTLEFESEVGVGTTVIVKI